MEAALLKTTFSVRRLAPWHLISRDTSALTPSQVAAATIQSVAESTSDGIMAPLLSTTYAGLPGALAYRFAGTADSMLGYRDLARESLGKLPARWDDVLDLVPARLTALLLATGAALVGEDAGLAWRTWRRDRRKTASPYAGHPMSAMAGALGIALEKGDHYKLGGGDRKPEGSDITRAVRVMRAAVALGAGLVVGVCLLQDRSSRLSTGGESTANCSWKTLTAG